MEPPSIRVDKVPGVVFSADGDAGDTHRTAEELEIVGVVAAGTFQFSAVRGKGPNDSSNGFFVIGHQGAQVVVQVLHLFPVAPHLVCRANDRLDKVIGRLVDFGHLGR